MLQSISLSPIIENFLTEIEQELSNLLGETFQLQAQKIQAITANEYIQSAQENLIVNKTATYDEEKSKPAYIILPLKAAHTLVSYVFNQPLDQDQDEDIDSKVLESKEVQALDQIVDLILSNLQQKTKEVASKINFSPKEQEIINPSNIDQDSPPLAWDDYYLLTLKMSLDEQDLGHIDILLSSNLFTNPPEQSIPDPEEESTPTEQDSKNKIVQELLDDTSEESQQKAESEEEEEQGEKGEEETWTGIRSFHIRGDKVQNPAIVIITEDKDESQIFMNSIDHQKVELCHLSLESNIKDKLQQYDVIGSFLVIKEVNEHSLANLIKVRSLLKGRCPLIMAAPQWTRTMVIKAMRYGASDIISLPAEPELIKKKCQQHILDNYSLLTS